MNTSPIAGAESSVATLRRLARGKAATEQCEFCSAVLQPGHRHLFELATRKIICTCDACALRFENVAGRWKLIPRDVRSVPRFQLTDAQWDSLALPIQLAFCFYSSAAKRVIALYPSPAGATESLLPLTQWENIVVANPCLAKLQADVEALLVNRLGVAPLYYIAPIDLCFELVGLIRLHWRGLSGGDSVWREIEAFFARLDSLAFEPSEPSSEPTHA